VIDFAAAACAWLGAALVVLADGRRGLALGLAAAAAGLSVLAIQDGGGAAFAALAAGGAVASLAQLRSGPAGWGVMPPGSTPRLVLCIGAGLVGLWFAGSLTLGPDAPVRFAVLAVMGMMGLRIVTSDETPVVLAALAVLALAAATAAGLASTPPGAAPYVAAALIAAGALLVRRSPVEPTG